MALVGCFYLKDQPTIERAYGPDIFHWDYGRTCMEYGSNYVVEFVLKAYSANLASPTSAPEIRCIWDAVECGRLPTYNVCL